MAGRLKLKLSIKIYEEPKKGKKQSNVGRKGGKMGQNARKRAKWTKNG
jgi:hypothetical protein